MVIEYKVRDITLNQSEIAEIDKYYEAACTANYVLDNYPEVRTEGLAMEIGYEVRRKMNKYGYDEAEAIEEVMEEFFPEDEEEDDE